MKGDFSDSRKIQLHDNSFWTISLWDPEKNVSRNLNETHYYSQIQNHLLFFTQNKIYLKKQTKKKPFQT